MEEEVIAQGLTAFDWLLAVGVFAAGIVAGRLVQAFVTRRYVQDDGELGAASAIGRAVGLMLSVAGFVYALLVLEVRLTPLLGAIGIGGIAIALAAQTVLANALASTLLRLRHPFRRGDQIRTNDLEGRVLDVNFRTVVLMSMDGEVVHLPASKVLDEPITNLTARSRRRTTLDVGVDYSADLVKVRELLLEAARSAEGVLEPAPDVHVVQFGESSIDFAVRFWHGPTIAEMWRTRTAVAIAAKGALDRAGIEIPFPQRTLSWRPADEDDDPGASGTDG
ncbi:MAG: mechanosensitive ion channel family protein [Acidimicrobiales bacterium]